jgi:hypothetical protein
MAAFTYGTFDLACIQFTLKLILSLFTYVHVFIRAISITLIKLFLMIEKNVFYYITMIIKLKDIGLFLILQNIASFVF